MIHPKNILKQKFKMKDQGKIKYFLGIEFTYEDNIIYMHQKQCIQKLLEKFGMKDCKPKYTPNDSNINKMCSESSKFIDGKLYKETVGSLIYAMTTTRPDLCFIVTKLSQFMSEPYEKHMKIEKHVLRYIKGTINQQLTFKLTKSTLGLTGFCDADWAERVSLDTD